jgi:hypothetical protein
MDLEGLESRPTVFPGRSPHWVKVKNRQHPAFRQVMEQALLQFRDVDDDVDNHAHA